jgi:nucleotide-binding universal stress UspA family protein
MGRKLTMTEADTLLVPHMTVPEMHIANVLVPIDGSELSLEAIPTARSLARLLSADLHTISAARSERGADRLRALGAAAVDLGPADAHIAVVMSDDPAAAIAERAQALGACVVCLSTHGRGRLNGAILGSVTEALLRRSSDAVVALGPSAERPGWSPAPTWPAPFSVKRIVACVDGTPSSEEVLPTAIAWARTLGMAMTILTIDQDILAPVDAGLPASRSGQSADVHTYVEGLVHDWMGRGVEVSGEVVSDPIGPASGIRDHLARHPAGLVAVSTHARSGRRRLGHGAAAAKIVRDSITPCLMVPVGQET